MNVGGGQACASRPFPSLPRSLPLIPSTMVKITFKTLQQSQFFIEAEPTETILDVKKKIESQQGHPVTAQKIIFSGKVLADDKTVGEVEFKEKDFCVVMITKPKPAPAPKPAASAAAPTPSAAIPSTPAQASTPPVAPNAPAPAPASTETSNAEAETPSQSSGNGGSFLMGSALETSVNEMVSMGFPKEMVMRAMRASFNNPDRAVEYLMNGIPETSNQDAPPTPAPAGGAAAPGTPSPASATGNVASLAETPAPATNAPRNLFEAAAAASRNPPPPAAAPVGATAPSGGGGGSSDMAAIAQQPIFSQLRSLVQQNPALLQPFLQQLGASNPELLSVIDRNQAEFVRFLQQGGEGGGEGGDDDMGGLLDQFGDDGGEGGEGGGMGGQQIQVTEEEMAAIDRLAAMGFERQMVIQAYLACDRNEELAANYLLEHGFDFDD